MQDTKLVVIASNTFIYGEVCDYTVGFEYDPDYSIPASTDNFTFTLTSAGLPTITIGPLPINSYYFGTIPYCVAGISEVLLFPPGTYTLHVTSDFRSDEYYNAPPDLYKTIVINPGKAIIELTPSENPTTPTQLETIIAYIRPSAAGQPVGNIDLYYLDTNINPSAYVQIGPTATFNSSHIASSSSTLPPSTTQGKTATWPIYYYYYNDPNFAPIGTSHVLFLSNLSIIIYPPSTYIILDTNPTTGLVYSEPFEVSATLTGFNPNAKLSIGWPTINPPTPYFTYNLNTLGINNAIKVGSFYN